MSDRDDITAAYAEGFDVKRELLYGDIKLQFFEKKTADPVLLLEIKSGWLPSAERIRGQIETLFMVRVCDQPGLVASATSRVNRLRWGNNYCTVNSYDPPQGAPSIWTFFTKEIKTGAIK